MTIEIVQKQLTIPDKYFWRYKLKKDLGNDSISKLLIELSAPAILSMLVAAIYNIVDRIFVGQVNPLGLAAIGITMPFQVVQMAFVLLIGIGGSTLVSIKYGEGNIKSAEKILTNSLWYIVITQIIVTVLCLIFIDPIFSLLGVSKSLYNLAKDYIYIILLGGMPGLTGYCLNNFVRSLGFSKKSMIIVLLSSVLNIILDAILILQFGMGVKGAAIATVISQTIVTVFVLKFFMTNKDTPIKLKLKGSSLDFKVIKETTQNGLPNFYMQIFGTAVNIILNNFIIMYGGDYHMASVTIITSIGLFFSMVIYGISQGAQPIIGFNFGAKKMDRCVEVVRKTTIFIFLISSFFLALIEIFPSFFVHYFTTEKNLLDITIINIRIFLIGLPFIALHSIATTYFQSTRKPKVASILYFLKYGAILIPLLFILPSILGILGVYLSNAMSDAFSGLVAFVFLMKDIRKVKTNKSTELL